MTTTIIIMVMIVTTMNMDIMEGDYVVCWFLVAGDTPKMYPLDLYLGPKIPIGFIGYRPPWPSES